MLLRVDDTATDDNISDVTRTTRAAVAAAVGVTLAAMALYAATLQPAFGGPEDTPKFQFLGYVLGTAHPPGYPLYAMLSHLFVQLPIGTIAYRANLFSAVMAALSCGLAYVIAQQLGARRWFAAASALGLASGASFWRSAVFAEVYSLAAFCVAASVAALLAWGRRGGSHRLLTAAAAFAAGLGNHLTIVGIAPACAVYAFATHRTALRLPVLAATALIGVLGLAQYAFIIVRTQQAAPYLESRAESVHDLVGIIRADRYAEQRFAFSARDVLLTKVPSVARVIAAELMPVGLVCVVAGIVATMVRRSASAALVLGAAAGMFAMIVNMEGDVKGFITPVVVLLWPLAALGLESASARFRMPTLVSGAMALALPVTGVAANYRESDQSAQTTIARFLRQTYANLPDHAAVVAEDYFYDMAHEYFTATQEAGPVRGVTKVGYRSQEVRAAVSEGRRVFAFAGAASILAAEGLWFERTSVQEEDLESWLQRLPRGTVLAGSAAFAPVPFDAGSVGHAGVRGAGRVATFEAFVLVVGRQGALWRRDENRASLVLTDRAAPPWLSGIEARADSNGAWVLSDGRPIAMIPAGFALAAFNPDGSLAQTLELGTGDPRQVDAPESIYELKGDTPCVELTRAGWQDVSAVLSTGSAVATLAERGAATIEIELTEPALDARASNLLGDGDSALVYRYHAGVFDADWRIERTGGRRPLFRLAFNQPVTAGRARLAATSPLSTASVCSHRPSRPLARPGATRIRLQADFESEAFFGAGWGGVERRRDGAARRGENGATLLLPLDANARYRGTFAVASDAPRDVVVVVNGTTVGTCRVDGTALCDAPVPASGEITTVRFLTDEKSTLTFLGGWFTADSSR